MNKRSLLYLLGIIIVLFAGFKVYQSLQFRMTGTSPSVKQVSVISPFIDVNFSKALDKNKIELASNQKFISNYNLVGDKTLRVYLTDLTLDADYTLSINSVTAISGKELKNISLRFTAQNIPFDKLNKTQQEAILGHQDKPTPSKSDPILSHLPYGGLDFELTAVAGQSGTLSLHARLLLSAADVRTDEAGATAQYKKEVQDYIRSLGLNPDKYVIDYEIVKPSI